MKYMVIFGVVLSFLFSVSISQENAGTNVAPSLQECYNTTRHVVADYRLPTSINILIEMLRRIEDGNPNQSPRELAVQILQRFRQDGIRKSTVDIDASRGLPYSPKGWEAYRNQIQLKNITPAPGGATNFNNDSLSSLQSCSLHFMISSTIDSQNRGAEEANCGKISRYTSRIIKREISEFADTDPNAKSNCPIEEGVIYTRWGAIKGGLLLAGIASGYENNPMNIQNIKLDSSYASTIAGELAENVLHQGKGDEINVGHKGNWNSTVEPKYYFLDGFSKFEMFLTDAEIRGSLDGLFLGLALPQLLSQRSDLKISQLVELYYGRGVFNTTQRACNRKNIISSLITDDLLINQTYGFSQLLNDISQLGYSPNEEFLRKRIPQYTDKLRTYIDSLQDLECTIDDEATESVSTDIFIFIDSSWNYKIIQPLISSILEYLNINKYESSYTIFDGVKCEVIVNKSRSILDFYEYYNETIPQKYPTGFDFIKTVQVSEQILMNKLNNETDLTGQSTIILMLPHKNPTSSEAEYVKQRRETFRKILPDARIIVGASGSRESFDPLVTTPQSDIILIGDDLSETMIKEAGITIVNRLKQIPRNVVNKKCGSTFSSNSEESFETTHYVEPQNINYHKISPHYFYKGRNLKIRGQGYGTIKVCVSRTESNPKENSTSTRCQTLNSDEMNTDISGYCIDQSTMDCSPIYLSVKGETSSINCREKECRFPDNIKYIISLENVHCSGSTELMIPGIFIGFLLFIITRI